MATTRMPSHITFDDDIADTGVNVSTIRCHPFPESTQVAETMIFGGALGQQAVAWRSLDEARAGHARIVAALARGERPADLPTADIDYC